MKYYFEGGEEVVYFERISYGTKFLSGQHGTAFFRNTGKHANPPFPRRGVLGHNHEVLILIQRGAEGVGLAFFLEGEQVGNAGQGRGEWSLQGVVYGAKQRTCTITKMSVERALPRYELKEGGGDHKMLVYVHQNRAS